MTEMDTARFFDDLPQALPLYSAFVKKVCTKFLHIKIKVQKSQITLSNKHGFAYVWLPPRKMKGRPAFYLIISFGLPYRLDSPRINEAVEPYPNRWTHHVIIESPNDIDEEFMEWIDQAYQFTMAK